MGDFTTVNYPAQREFRDVLTEHDESVYILHQRFIVHRALAQWSSTGKYKFLEICLSITFMYISVHFRFLHIIREKEVTPWSKLSY